MIDIADFAIKRFSVDIESFPGVSIFFKISKGIVLIIRGLLQQFLLSQFCNFISIIVI